MACFFRPEDYSDYLDYLASFSRRFGCAIHAYCLMTNHVHVLLTPQDRISCARMMKQLNQCYVQGINRRSGRTGSLWEGRFHSALVDTERYALACYRYIELNPVRAGIVSQPSDYRWSSYRTNAEGTPDGLVSGHDAYLALGSAAERRTQAYRGLFHYSLEENTLEEIRKATRGGYRIGEARRARGRPGPNK